MTVRETRQNIVCLEYRQGKDDIDYGSCLWADFYFNLDKYEISIMSDCGCYGYDGWSITPTESFMHLMTRISEDYLREKLCGIPKEFDFDATKDELYDSYEDDEEAIQKLDEIFEEFEWEEPTSAELFLKIFDDANYDPDERCGYFNDTFEFPVYSYTPDQMKICQVFKEHIQPYIRENLYKWEVTE